MCEKNLYWNWNICSLIDEIRDVYDDIVSCLYCRKIERVVIIIMSREMYVLFQMGRDESCQ